MKSVTIDDRLNDVQEQLIREFSAFLPAETILEAARESRENYRNVRVSDFVPLFVSLEVRRRLAGLAQSVAS